MSVCWSESKESFNQHNLPILVQLPIRLYIGQSVYLFVGLYSVCLLYIHLIHVCLYFTWPKVLLTILFLFVNIIFVSCTIQSGNGFKKQELHQEYFCFLDEQFYFDQ